MGAVREAARAKINLALHVLGRRAGGLHELDSLVAFADIGDELTIEEADRFEIEATGPFAGHLPPAEGNIAAKAYRLLCERTGGLPPVRMRLVKNLPVAAGIGGGSADAAAALRGLVRLFGLSVPDLPGIALELGADVPVCLVGRLCRMQGVGERLTPVDGLGPFHAVLVNPLVLVPTAGVFRALGQRYGGELVSFEQHNWRNDLQDAALAVEPTIAEVLTEIERFTQARMSGSGATCFGIFAEEGAARAAAAAIAASHPAWWVVPTRLG